MHLRGPGKRTQMRKLSCARWRLAGALLFTVFKCVPCFTVAVVAVADGFTDLEGNAEMCDVVVLLKRDVHITHGAELLGKVLLE